MIRVSKDILDIPISLMTDKESLKSDPAKKTNERRNEVIKEGGYPPAVNSVRYDSRYKRNDIKIKLEELYHGKCAFCETSGEQLHVEHFRPKRGGYYWLAYSWDNLLLACPTCNEKKGNSFPIGGRRVSYDPNRDTTEKINGLTALYDLIEEPLLVNPETAPQDLFDRIEFDMNGRIFSSDRRVMETIKICDLDRKGLRERRQKIWDDLRGELEAVLLESKDDALLLEVLIGHVLRDFMCKSKDPKNNYLSYRRYILRSNWIKALLHDYAR